MQHQICCFCHKPLSIGARLVVSLAMKTVCGITAKFPYDRAIPLAELSCSWNWHGGFNTLQLNIWLIHIIFKKENQVPFNVPSGPLRAGTSCLQVY